MDATAAKKLRAEFPAAQIGKLPRARKDANGQKGAKGRCAECGGWHELPAIHLDFVGHAHVTNRILEVDPDYEFGPVLDVNKRPVTQQAGSGMEVLYYLTINGSTKYEWGEGPNMKEISSDAIRRCAMRFGVALDLWAKEPMEDGQDGARSAPAAQGRVERAPTSPKKTTTSQQTKIAIAASDAGIDTDLRHRITYSFLGVKSSKDVLRKDVTDLLATFKRFAADRDANLKKLEAWEAEHLPTTAAQQIREGDSPARREGPEGSANSPSATATSPPGEADGEHILTPEILESAGQIPMGDVIPD